MQDPGRAAQRPFARFLSRLQQLSHILALGSGQNTRIVPSDQRAEISCKRLRSGMEVAIP